jgi:hypothetical protein
MSSDTEYYIYGFSNIFIFRERSCANTTFTQFRAGKRQKIRTCEKVYLPEEDSQ